MHKSVPCLSFYFQATLINLFLRTIQTKLAIFRPYVMIKGGIFHLTMLIIL